MAIMETIRRSTDSTLMKLVFGAIVLVFVFWGIGATGGPTSQVIAEVNGKRLTDTQLQREMRYRTRSSGGSLDEDQVNAMARQVIAELIEIEVLLQEADRVGIEVSNQEVARVVSRTEAFQGEDGKFSSTLYDRALKRMGMTRGRFEEEIRNNLTLQKLQMMAASSIYVSDEEVRTAYRAEQARIQLDLVLISDSAMLDKVPVDEGSIDALIVAAPEDVKAAYDADLDRLYKKPRTAEISLILKKASEGGDTTTARAELENLLAQARGGADFAELAEANSEDPSASVGGRVGPLAEAQMDNIVSAAVFAIEAGAITDVLETSRGLQIVKVEAITDALLTPLEDVQRDIARAILAKQQVELVAQDLAETLRADWKATGAPPAERLQEYGLEVRSVGPTSPGRPRLSGIISPSLEAALANVTSTGLLDDVYPMPGGRLIATVSQFDEADMALWDTLKPSMEARMKLIRKQEFVSNWTEDLLERARVIQHYNP
jgi:peptidyl-prolyl cis-trans isomerase D